MGFLADFLKMDKYRTISELRYESILTEHGALEGQNMRVTLAECGFIFHSRRALHDSDWGQDSLEDARRDQAMTDPSSVRRERS
jgi:hypothetical protein